MYIVIKRISCTGVFYSSYLCLLLSLIIPPLVGSAVQSDIFCPRAHSLALRIEKKEPWVTGSGKKTAVRVFLRQERKEVVSLWTALGPSQPNASFPSGRGPWQAVTLTLQSPLLIPGLVQGATGDRRGGIMEIIIPRWGFSFPSQTSPSVSGQGDFWSKVTFEPKQGGPHCLSPKYQSPGWGRGALEQTWLFWFHCVHTKDNFFLPFWPPEVKY